MRYTQKGSDQWTIAASTPWQREQRHGKIQDDLPRPRNLWPMVGLTLLAWLPIGAVLAILL